MWISQSYMATVEPDAKIFIYYLFEDYNEQGPFTKKVQRHLERMGETHGGEVSLLMPNPRYADRIEAEMREIRPLWEMIYSGLPGLLVSTEPMATLSENTDGCVFIPFDGQEAQTVADKIAEVRRLTQDQINHMFANAANLRATSLSSKLKDSMELKPGIFGIKLDLRKVFSRT